jgi:hypothetical protein
MAKLGEEQVMVAEGYGPERHIDPAGSRTARSDERGQFGTACRSEPGDRRLWMAGVCSRPRFCWIRREIGQPVPSGHGGATRQRRSEASGSFARPSLTCCRRTGARSRHCRRRSAERSVCLARRRDRAMLAFDATGRSWSWRSQCLEVS